jgi:hypothetical protein
MCDNVNYAKSHALLLLLHVKGINPEIDTSYTSLLAESTSVDCYGQFIGQDMFVSIVYVTLDMSV